MHVTLLCTVALRPLRILMLMSEQEIVNPGTEMELSQIRPGCASAKRIKDLVESHSWHKSKKYIVMIEMAKVISCKINVTNDDPHSKDLTKPHHAHRL